MGLPAEIEEDVRLLPDDVTAVDSSDRLGGLASHRGEWPRVEARAAGRVGARLPGRAGPGLIHEVVAKDPAGSSEPARDMPPSICVAAHQAHAAGTRVIGPEVVEGVLESRVGEVVGRESVAWIRQAVVLYRPVGPALALELLVVEVLVEVEQ